jgi:Ca-activated chloride channel family protein
MFRFEDPWLLLIGIVLIPIVIWSARSRGSAAIRFSGLEPFRRIPNTRRTVVRQGLIGLRCLGIGLCVAALARPQSGQKETEILTEGVDIVLCLDTSGSMRALDFELDGQRVDRLAVVKKVVEDFIRKRKDDRIGMVIFGAQAFTQCPLTMDYGVLLTFLKRAEIGMAGDSTAIGSALATSVKRLKDVPAKSKLVILLTDGRSNTGRIPPETAADIARSMNVKVYTIGVGVEGKSPFLVDTLFGKNYVFEKVDLDEDTLKKIAQVTGGEYFRATNTASLEKIYDQIDRMEKTEAKVKEYTEYEELFHRFALPGLLLLLAEFVLVNTRFRKIP